MHVLQCQHHLRRLPQQDAVSLGCSDGSGDLCRNRTLFRSTNAAIGVPLCWQRHGTCSQREHRCQRKGKRAYVAHLFLVGVPLRTAVMCSAGNEGFAPVSIPLHKI